MFLLQKPKFPMHMNLIDICQKIFRRKNYFPWNVIFSPEISHIHTPTKIGFPRNKPKMHQLHKNTTSSKMVVRGWYRGFSQKVLVQRYKKINSIQRFLNLLIFHSELAYSNRIRRMSLFFDGSS